MNNEDQKELPHDAGDTLPAPAEHAKGAGNTLPAPTDQEPANLSYDQLAAISERWVEASELASLKAEILIPRALQTIHLTGAVPGNKKGNVKIKSVDVVFTLEVCNGQACCPENNPTIDVYVYHDSGKLRADTNFDAGVSAAISKLIGKPVAVKQWEYYDPHEGCSAMECVDSQSSWHLADYVLNENGYEGGEAETAPASGE